MPGGLAPRPIWLLLACLAALATGLLLNAYLLVDWQGFSAAMLHTLRIRTVDSGIQYGNRWAPYQPAWLFVIRYPLGYGVGFAFTAWFLLGLAWSLYRRTRTDLILLAWIVPYWLLVSAEPAKFMRYSAPLLVPLAVLAGRFTLEMVGARLIPAKWPVITLAAAATALTAIYVLAYDGLYGVPDPRQTVAAWITSHSRPGTTVGYEEIPDGVVNLPYFVPKNRLTCIAQYQASHLRGVRYMVLDSYTVEEQPSSEDALMTRFRAYLGRTYHVARVVHDVPTFLGLRFPIDGSPHDWRYADHVMTVYASSRSPVQGRSNPYCFNSVAAASNALYVKPASTGASGSQTG